jgi:hypothetical protein
VDVTQPGLAEVRGLYRLCQLVRVEWCQCLHDVTQTLGGDAHGVQLLDTLGLGDVGRIRFEGVEALQDAFACLPIDTAAWHVDPIRLILARHLLKPLLHRLGELAGGQALQSLDDGPLQGLAPLLQTQEEALDPSALLGARTVVQKLLHAGHLDIGITHCSQDPGDTTQLLAPPRTGLARQRGSKQGQHAAQAA